MKKLNLIAVSILGLVTVLTVSSFAWFQLKNNGILSTNVGTANKVVIHFSESGTNGESMVPAKLKKGVINSPSGTIVGNEASDLVGKKLLPKTENYQYVIENSNFVTQSEYLEHPASIVYSQFESMFTNSDSTDTPQTFTLSFPVKYFNVDESVDTPINDLTTFLQVDALTFNLFVFTRELTSEELRTLTTNSDSAINNVTIEKFIIDNQASLGVHSNEGIGGLGEVEITTSNVESYRYNIRTTGESTTYSVRIENLAPSQIYYFLIESYYSLPDKLIEGNLPLTGKFVLNLTYSQVNQ